MYRDKYDDSKLQQSNRFYIILKDFPALLLRCEYVLIKLIQQINIQMLYELYFI